MNKSGGVVRAVANRQAYVFVYALILVAAVMAALAVERFGQQGTLSVLAVMAASGLPWLTGRVQAEGEADDTPKGERIVDGAGAGEGGERKPGRAGESAPAAERAARAADPGRAAGPYGRQPGREPGRADRGATGGCQI